MDWGTRYISHLYITIISLVNEKCSDIAQTVASFRYGFYLEVISSKKVQ